MNKIKKNDTVIVISGKDKGKEGKVVKVLPKNSKVLVEGINIVVKHQKPSYMSAGGIVKKESPIHWSNVAIKDPKTGKPTRVKIVIKDSKKVRVCVKSGEIID